MLKNFNKSTLIKVLGGVTVTLVIGGLVWFGLV